MSLPDGMPHPFRLRLEIHSWGNGRPGVIPWEAHDESVVDVGYRVSLGQKGPMVRDNDGERTRPRQVRSSNLLGVHILAILEHRPQASKAVRGFADAGPAGLDGGSSRPWFIPRESLVQVATPSQLICGRRN